jgi:hypothetical protein
MPGLHYLWVYRATKTLAHCIGSTSGTDNTSDIIS